MVGDKEDREGSVGNATGNDDGDTMKGYLSVRETSYKWNVSERRVNQYVTEGRIPGVERFGRSWAIPENAKKPEDPRRAKK